MADISVIAVAFLLGYLLGTIPFGLILTKLAGAGDLRAIGSGNIGATNVLRTGRKGLAAATLLGDALKGTVAAAGALYVAGFEAGLAAGFGAFLGHLFPVWLRFKGGKGVATYIGVLVGLAWPAALVFCAAWLGTAAASRYSSLAALVASIAAPIFLWWTSSLPIVLLFIAMTALLWIKHRDNIARLASGTEGHIGQR